jgi:hypothetical protein
MGITSLTLFVEPLALGQQNGQSLAQAYPHNPCAQAWRELEAD